MRDFALLNTGEAELQSREAREAQPLRGTLVKLARLASYVPAKNHEQIHEFSQ